MAHIKSWFIGFFFFLNCLSAANCQAQAKRLLMSSEDFQKATWIIRDSLRAGEQYLGKGRPAAAEKLATNLLKLYPLTPSYTSGERDRYGNPYYQQATGYPGSAYALRAKAREALGKYAAAETDITIALRSLPYRYILNLFGQPELWNYHELRARLRLNHLKDQTGGCQDLSFLYQLDSARAAGLGSYPCAIPRFRFATNDRLRAEAYKAAYDSLILAESALARKQYATVIRITNQLINGNVGRFIRYPVNLHYKITIPGNLYGIRAQAKEGLQDYKGSAADLDTAIYQLSQRCGSPGDGLWYYLRGKLRMDHLNNREGGCADFYQAYHCDTTLTSPQHPKWRGCELPKYKRAIGDEEKKEAQKVFDEGIRIVDTLLARKDYENARLLATGLIKGYAGRFEKIGLPGYGNYKYVGARSRRAIALEGLQRYKEAVADLDTALLSASYAPNIGWVYCQRAALKLDFLNDTTGCSDFRKCYTHGYKPANKNWRGCDFKEKTAAFNLSQNIIHPVFDDLDTWKPRLGVFNQGNWGLELGMLLSRGEWLVNWGPSIGIDLMVGNPSSYVPVIAPKLAFEGQIAILASRIDFTYFGYEGRQDLRFTPQVGLSLLATANLLYGYAIPLLSEKQPFLSPHRVSIYLNFVKLSKIGG